jgi:hypothetical protein
MRDSSLRRGIWLTTAAIRAAFGRGDVMVTGSVHGVGFMTWGTPGGSLTLLGAHGSVTAELVGPGQAGFAPLPHYFHFRVADGTGAYGNLHEQGTVRVDLLANGTFRLAF